MKHLLFAAYIFSVLYCYVQLNTLIDRCVEVFKERHPAIPMDAPAGWKGLKLTAELVCVSAVPVFNLFLGCFIAKFDDTMVSEVINNLETNHWQEIQDAEKELNGRLNNLDKYF